MILTAKLQLIFWNKSYVDLDRSYASEWLRNNSKFSLWEWLLIPFPQINIKDNIGNRNT